MHIILIATLPPIIYPESSCRNWLEPVGCIVRQPHTETLSQEEKKIENEKTNKLKNRFHISFHIRTMHTTGFPLEKSGLPHQLYRHTKIILREKYQETNNPTYYSRILLVFVCAVFKSLYRSGNQPSKLCLSICLHSPPAHITYPTMHCVPHGSVLHEQQSIPARLSSYYFGSDCVTCLRKSTSGFFCGCLWPTFWCLHIGRSALQPCLNCPVWGARSVKT